MIQPLCDAEEREIVKDIPEHAPGDRAFTAMEMARMYATLHRTRRDAMKLIEMLRECRELIGDGSTFGIALRIDSLLQQFGG